jgi:hypothetical protein
VRARTMRCLCYSQGHAIPTTELRTSKVLKFDRLAQYGLQESRAQAQVLHPGKEFRDGCRWRSSCPRPSRAPISISRAVGGSAHSRRRGCAEPSRVARWSSPQPAEPIMATMWLDRYSASATVHNNLPLKPGRTAPPLDPCASSSSAFAPSASSCEPAPTGSTRSNTMTTRLRVNAMATARD